MSDISTALQGASAAALRTDAGVKAGFCASPIQIFTLPPNNATEPYLVLGPARVDPLLAEGFDLSEIEYPVHIWSRTNPPALDEAQAIAGAVRGCMLGVSVASGGLVYCALPVRTQYLIDPSDERTVHAIVTTRFTTAPG